MQLTDDSFRALASSSPWRWRTLHFTRTDPPARTHGPAEAWVRRPGEQVVLQDGRRSEFRQTDPGGGRSWVSTDPDFVAPEIRWAHHLVPELRPDGLVAARPGRWTINYDEPIHQDYTWVAMLDPAELAEHVTLTNLAETERRGRRTWWATASAEEGYDPRCSCCALLWSAISDAYEAESGNWTPAPDTVYPDVWICGLDVQTGVLVSLTPIPKAGLRTDLGFEVEIHEVDGDVDHMLSPAD